jgi:GNAT superfamily N-acetyltransferase
VNIQACREQDLQLLEAGSPSPGQTREHARRFERQQQGASTYLIAWADGIPAGRGEILWHGCAAPEVNQRYPRCPELNGLEVWPAERRSQGTGTAVIRAAETLARERGCHQIGLGVDDDNPRAAALYLSPRPTQSGPSSRTTSTSARSSSAPADGPTEPGASTSMLL